MMALGDGTAMGMKKKKRSFSSKERAKLAEKLRREKQKKKKEEEAKRREKIEKQRGIVTAQQKFKFRELILRLLFLVFIAVYKQEI